MTQTQGKEYVEQCRRSGMSDEKIRELLLKAGWIDVSVDAVLGGGNRQRTGDPTKNSKAVTSLILGVFSQLLGFIAGIPAVIFGILGLSSKRRKMAIAGIVLGVIGSIAPVATIILYIFVLTFVRSMTVPTFEVNMLESNIDFNESARIISHVALMEYTANSIYEIEGSYASATCDHSDISLLCEIIAEHGFGEVNIVALPGAWCASAPLHGSGMYCMDSVGGGGSSGCLATGRCE